MFLPSKLMGMALSHDLAHAEVDQQKLSTSRAQLLLLVRLEPVLWRPLLALAAPFRLVLPVPLAHEVLFDDLLQVVHLPPQCGHLLHA